MDALNIGNKIKELRNERDLSMDMLVSDINRLYGVKITKSMVSRWESNKNVPTLESMKCLVLYFNVSLDWFFPSSYVHSSFQKFSSNLSVALYNVIASHSAI